MKFSNVLLSLLATVSVQVNATPVPGTTELVSRGPDDTPEYNLLAAAHPGLQKDKNYAFEIIWPRGSGRGETGEAASELSQVRNALGFDHIGIIIGQVKETPIGNPKDKKVKKSFVGVTFDIVKNTSGKNVVREKAGITSTTRTVRFVKEVKPADVLRSRKNANDWVTANPVYNPRTANCNHFVQAMKGKM